jgi:hypothetical protein
VITTLVSDAIDSRFFSLAAGALVSAYAISRGFTKAGSAHEWDEDCTVGDKTYV